MHGSEILSYDAFMKCAIPTCSTLFWSVLFGSAHLSVSCHNVPSNIAFILLFEVLLVVVDSSPEFQLPHAMFPNKNLNGSPDPSFLC